MVYVYHSGPQLTTSEIFLWLPSNQAFMVQEDFVGEEMSFFLCFNIGILKIRWGWVV